MIQINLVGCFTIILLLFILASILVITLCYQTCHSPGEGRKRTLAECNRILSENSKVAVDTSGKQILDLEEEKSENSINPGFLSSAISPQDETPVREETQALELASRGRKVIQVPSVYFRAVRGGSVELFNDAHSGLIPHFPEGKGLFPMIENDLREAREYIYIIGYSLCPEILLNRAESELSLGQILKQKDAEGVEIKLLLWKEIGSVFSDTDEATIREYFKGTDIDIIFAKRANACAYNIKPQFMWTHHQKCIIADSIRDGVVAYLGGYDVSKGRWDTSQHCLFSTLAKEHANDFRNAFVNLSSEQGPRQPWHDTHARVSGPVTLNLLKNFRERWERERRRLLNIQKKEQESLILPTEIRSSFASCSTTQGGIYWITQVLRSIDDTSADFQNADSSALVQVGGSRIDNSIEKGVTEVIRNAEVFLYIESQYFIGSSQYWDCTREYDTVNQIPYEIVKKIISKIRLGQQFCVYIVIPMLPEMNTESILFSHPGRAIIYLQYQTMQMMYREIAKELKSVGLKSHPTDYLLFLCLGKQESRPNYAENGLTEPKPNSKESKWHDLSHFLIYVHSKLLIADDCYIVQGSANYNDRSFAGNRDTEIAILAQQSQTTGNVEHVISNGCIQEFRRRLWCEHTWGLSETDSALRDPGSLGAIQRIRELADDALRAYTKGAGEHPVRFLRYPFDVTQDGQVLAFPDIPTFPDFDKLDIEKIMRYQ